jgi:hypothetical protein
MKMSLFEYKMTKLDHLILEADAANTHSAAQLQRCLKAINKTKTVPETAFFEGDDLLFDNVPI